LDKNFGVYLSIFDYLFGTACRDRSVYPQTGIDDSRFPNEDKVPLSQLPKNWLAQTIYPFKQMKGELEAFYKLRLSHFRFRLRRIRNIP
jgi:hypothetical protein